MATICNTCGLPTELCVCEDVAKEEKTVEVDFEERKYNTVTLVRNLPPEVDHEELASELKSQLACGGTIQESGTIELQGEHDQRAPDILSESGFSVEVVA